jgi:hypothetical protein
MNKEPADVPQKALVRWKALGPLDLSKLYRKRKIDFSTSLQIKLN